MNKFPTMNSLFVFLLWLCPIAARAVIVFQPDEANGTLFNDSFRGESIPNRGERMSVGDFNGDGLDDAAILVEVSSATRSIELFLAPFDKESGFLSKAHSTLFLDGPGLIIDLPSIKMADLNGDGRDDLAVYRFDAIANISQIQIVFGEKNLPAAKDLDQGEASLKIVGVSGDYFGNKMAAGDFNGDGADDYALLSSSETSSHVYFVLGGGSLPAGAVDLSIHNPFPRLSVEGYVDSLVTGNFNGDPRDDLAMGSFRKLGKAISVFWGPSSFPAAGGADLTTNVQIIGRYSDLSEVQNFIEPISAGDITGDHRDELVVRGLSSQYPQWIVNGSDLSFGRPILRQQTGFPESVVFYPVPGETTTFGWNSIFADFDNDGAKDLFSFYPIDVGGLLTTDVHPGGIPLNSLGFSSVGWVGDFSLFGLGDFNGDGFQDLVAYENFNSIYAPYGALRFLYGFRPLKNPRITALAELADSLRVMVSLSVEGNPAEMFFSGDVTPEFKDKWVPFRPTEQVVLTPGGGTKTIRVRFKNAVGRESDTVETVVTVVVKNPQVFTETNRLRPGRTVSFDCHVLNEGTLRVLVYGPKGEEVKELENRPVESGIYPVQWDGRNSHGNPVARGVYYLLIEADGERTKKEILVE